MIQYAIILAMSLIAIPAHADLTITFGGDVNFNKNKQAPLPDGVNVWGRKYSFSETTAGIRHLIDGDVNFANIETVVTDERDLPAQAKTFVFRSHPNALRHLLDLGFNLFSLANNHSYNHGFGGLDETLNSMEEFERESRYLTHAGIERRRSDFERAKIMRVGSHTIAFASIGITNDAFRATATRTGVLSYRNESDYELVLKSLRDASADLKILSIHAGIEMKTSTEPDLRKRFERAIAEGDADLVLGHHPHVVRPVALMDGRAVFYSLGNYLMLGAADIGSRGVGSDYGLFGRAHYVWDASARRLKLQAVEAVPLTQMHLNPKPLSAPAAAQRIRYLNEISSRDLGRSNAMEFRVRDDGSGVSCLAETLPYSARARAACQAK